MRLWRKYFSRSLPGSSSPTMPTGRTFTPRSARLFAALAAPPGTTVRSRCFKISTGASRDTREISPNTNSSATRSPRTVMVTLGNASIILRSRSASFKCLVIRSLVAVSGIFSRAPPPFLDHAQHGIHNVSRVGQFHLDGDDRQRRERRQISAQVHRIFFGGDEAAALTALPELQQIAHVFFCVGVMIAEKRLGCGIDARGPQLQQKILWPRNAAEHHGPRRNILRYDAPPHSPDRLTLQRERFRRSATGQHHSIRSLQRMQRLS